MTPFAHLEKQANIGKMVGSGVRSLWRKGAWGTLQRAATKGVARGGTVGRLSKATLPVANVMSGKVGTGLGLYGLTSLAFPDLPGSTLALNLSMPILGGMAAAGNLTRARRAGSEGGQAAIKKDMEAGASRAVQDFISGLYVNPSVAGDVDAYRTFSKQIGRGMDAADTYTKGGYRPMGNLSTLQNLFANPDELIKNRVRTQTQQLLPGIMKQAGIGGKLMGGLKVLGIGGATLGLGNAIFGQKPYAENAIQNEGYAAAQAAIQNRLKNMSSFERAAVRLDPTLAIDAVDKKLPGVVKEWESKFGPRQLGMLATIKDKFTNPASAKFYSTDVAGNRHYIN
jgi:hypothetical protein